MPTELAPNQHELCTSSGESLLLYGTVATHYLTLEHPQIEGGDERLSDSDRSRGDGVALGEDFHGGKTVSFSVGVLTDGEEDPHEAGADALDTFEGAWKDERLRDRASSYAMLRSRMVPGRVRVAYGRPRRYAETTDRLTHKGSSSILCEFLNADGRWYDDEASVAVFKTSGTVMIEGTRRTCPVITIRGPITSPTVVVGPTTYTLTGFIVAAGASVSIDTRPRHNSILTSAGGSVAGKLSPTSTSLSAGSLRPGTHATSLTGTGTTSATGYEVSWRNAYSRW